MLSSKHARHAIEARRKKTDRCYPALHGRVSTSEISHVSPGMIPVLSNATSAFTFALAADSKSRLYWSVAKMKSVLRKSRRISARFRQYVSAGTWMYSLRIWSDARQSTRPGARGVRGLLWWSCREVHCMPSNNHITRAPVMGIMGLNCAEKMLSI